MNLSGYIPGEQGQYYVSWCRSSLHRVDISDYGIDSVVFTSLFFNTRLCNPIDPIALGNQNLLFLQQQNYQTQGYLECADISLIIFILLVMRAPSVYYLDIDRW